MSVWPVPDLADPADLFAHDENIQIANTPATIAQVPVPQEVGSPRITIKVPVMPLTRSSHLSGLPAEQLEQEEDKSGSEYSASDPSMDVDAEHELEDEDAATEPGGKKSPVAYRTTRGGRKVQQRSYVESNTEDDDVPPPLPEHHSPATRRSTRSKTVHENDDDDEDEEQLPRRSTRSRVEKTSAYVSDDEAQASTGRYPTRNRLKKLDEKPAASTSHSASASHGSTYARPPPKTGAADRAKRMARRAAAQAKRENDDPDFIHDGDGSSVSGDDSLADAPHTSSEPDADEEAAPDDIEVDEPGDGEEEGNDKQPYSLRRRAKINYAIPPPLEEIRPAPSNNSRSRGGKSIFGGSKGRKGPGWSATGAELDRYMRGFGAGFGGGAADDSDSDYAGNSPRKPFASGFSAGGAMPGAPLLSGDVGGMGLAGTPSNMGKVGDAALADADPLGVNQNVTFDEVGGLDDHIHQLKEMTLLPLLYPEVFQQFGVTPPRGVLFHGPPGTGKTLMARALAASCRSSGRSISFFMRKGADVLSKWVGEAERQLRLLFEEARAVQPSIIFFDEIDGLAPVRSSKQDQIHASIVSTLLALMDGMDGRGQVVVIGATNRPDAVDPALRRPGRFDREFYFPLPGLEARERILGIMTKKWKGWEGPEVEETIKGLAKMTKGYGGADLRALCTEATLNAIQRRYPQIYQSNDRLLLKPETIKVGLRDFMISIKKLVPSSARSAASAATPIPQQLVPLLTDTLEQVKVVVNQVLPITKRRTALEEAQFEDEDEGALERELQLQNIEKLRVYRPRVAVYGPGGMGQGYIGPAILHHLEGFHVQSLDLGSLMNDSTRTVEAAIVQLFVEAKRNQPSVIYIPSLLGWSAAVSETARSTVSSMLDTLAPTDPVLLLAIVEGPFTAIPKDVRAWFGKMRENRIQILPPTVQQREAFFSGLIADVNRPPNQFADGVERKKRVLEVLPIAPPLEPRKPTPAELAAQEENDQRVIALLKYRLGPILQELKRKFKRFTKRAGDEYNYNFDDPPSIQAEPEVVQIETVTETIETTNGPDGTVEQVVDIERTVREQPPALSEQPQSPAAQAPPEPQLHNIDLERMNVDLYRSKYLTPGEFLMDIGRIVSNAAVRAHEDPERLFKAQAMYTAAEVSILDFDPGLKLECERMAGRERERREERRREKEKNKRDKNKDQQPPPSTRRSTRANGTAEFVMTDPTKLERRLKRARSESAEEHAHGRQNGEEGGDAIAMDEDERGTKRSRVGSDDERSPAGVVTTYQSLSTTPPHHPHVRFSGQIPNSASMEIIPETSPIAGDGILPNGNSLHTLPAAPASPQGHPSGVPLPLHKDVPASPLHDKGHRDYLTPEFSTPRKRHGFDTLLNPLPSASSSYELIHDNHTDVNGHYDPAAQPPVDALHFHNHPVAGGVHDFSVNQLVDPGSSGTGLDQAGLYHPLQVPQVIEPAADVSMASHSEPVSAVESMQAEQMPVEPPTPMPEFHVSEPLLYRLKTVLHEETEPLNVEQLEQLRAMLLGRVWRRRSEWNRDGMVKELADAAHEFVEEVQLDEQTDSEEP